MPPKGATGPIDLLVNNAGFGAYGEFHKLDLERQLSMVQVNCTAIVHLTRLFVPAMIDRRRGDILILASTASFQPVAYMSIYAATKVFDRFLAEALAEEVRAYGVRVSALCPGPTESEFMDVAGSRTGPAQVPERGGGRTAWARGSGPGKDLRHSLSRRPRADLYPTPHASPVRGCRGCPDVSSCRTQTLEPWPHQKRICREHHSRRGLRLS